MRIHPFTAPKHKKGRTPWESEKIPMGFFLCEFFLQGDCYVSISTSILSSIFRSSFPVTIDIFGKFFAIRHIAGFAIDQIFSIGISAASCDVLKMTQEIDPMAVFVFLLWSIREMIGCHDGFPPFAFC